MIKKTFNFEINKDANIKAIEINGFANAATPDRIGDLIEPKSWDLKNFDNNPIIFFNHDRNIPIGKAVGTKITDKGLEITARISKSKEAPIPYIRDMIEEGILKTFSVGFDDHGSSYQDNEDGLTKFEKAELLEVSVVTIPMNQDSLFSVSKDGTAYKTKAFESTADKWKTKSYSEVKKECLEMQGHLVAAAVNDAIDHADEYVKTFLLNHLNKDMLKGIQTPDDKFISLVCDVLDLDKKSLLELRAKTEEEKPHHYDDEEEKEEEDKEEEKEAEVEEAKEADAEDSEEKAEEEKEEDSPNKEFNECVSSKIPKLIEEGKDRDEAVAVAIDMCKESKSCEISDDDWTHFIALAKKSSETETKQAEAEEVKEAEAPVVPASENMNNMLPEGQPGIELQKSQLALQGSMLTTQKQTNTILTDLLNVMKTLEAKIGAQSHQQSEEQSFQEAEERELQKQISEIGRLTKRVDEILTH
jgi:HK97 family phage prohead protease